MRPVGFSTGALALGDFRRALQMMAGRSLECVELSALREGELAPLLGAWNTLALSPFRYVSFHAPSELERMTEGRLADHLAVMIERRVPVVVHPDIISDYKCWANFGRWLCIENMDRRKPIGRTARELGRIFDNLPDASLCLDVGHARQVDPTMSQAVEILGQFGTRLRQLHVSDVNTRSRHEPLNSGAVHAFQKIAEMIPEPTPVILETPVLGPAELDRQVDEARRALTPIETGALIPR